MIMGKAKKTCISTKCSSSLLYVEMILGQHNPICMVLTSEFHSSKIILCTRSCPQAESRHFSDLNQTTTWALEQDKRGTSKARIEKLVFRFVFVLSLLGCWVFIKNFVELNLWSSILIYSNDGQQRQMSREMWESLINSKPATLMSPRFCLFVPIIYVYMYVEMP